MRILCILLLPELRPLALRKVLARNIEEQLMPPHFKQNFDDSTTMAAFL